MALSRNLESLSLEVRDMLLSYSRPLSSGPKLNLSDVKSLASKGAVLNYDQSLLYSSHSVPTRRVLDVALNGVKLIVKFGTDVSLVEASTTRYVADNTTIRVPTVYATFVDDTQGPRPVTYIVEERLPGSTLGSILPSLNPSANETIMKELKDLIGQLSSLSAHRTSLGPLQGTWRNDYFRSFLERFPCTSDDASTTRDFIEYFLHVSRSRNISYSRNEEECLLPFDFERPPVFSHGDLGPSNIMVEDGHIAGIIDWEQAGWYPYFWDHFVASGASKGAADVQGRWASLYPQVFQTFLDEVVAFSKIWGDASFSYMGDGF